MTALVPLVVLVPLLGAAVTLALGFRPQAQRIVAIVALVIELGLGIALLIAVDAGGPLAMELGGWSAPFGIVLVVDRLSAVMVLVSALVLLAVLLFSVGQGIADGDEETPVSIYNPTYLILTTGVMVAFVSGDLFNLYVGFEILLVASYVLITLGGTEARIRAGVTYVIVSLLSSLLFLASIAMVYGALGTVNLAQVAARMQDLPADVQVLLHVMLLVAFGIKAAVFPLSFWLPDSYPSAPAPVTAAFAGLLTKIGVYAIIRVETVIFPGPELNPALMVVALLTMVVGALGAVAQADIKRILSFTLVSHIGYMILGVALGTAAGTAAAIYYIAHHIVIQTTLFLAAGLVEREAGSTSITRIGGLLASAPLVAVLFFVPALNLGGIPPFSGFIGKLGLFQAAAEQGDALAYVLIGAGALVSLLTLYALVRVWNLAFWRPAGEVEGDETRLLRTVEEAPHSTTTIAATRATSRLMTASTVLMVVVGIALTVFAGPLYGLADRAADNLDGPEQYIQIVFPQGVEP
ncbi:MAG: Na+/H+ antiporter subunit D [Microcella pacifica]|uniref:Na+/H+ antiporter subunit D n=1 Tax=Microcella pacifica TaxID=2591847 RepID=UPI0033148C5C